MVDVPASERPASLVVKDAHHAPVIYFEGAPNFGHNNNVINITLATSTHLSNGDGVLTEAFAVAHLRCNIPAAMDLRRAIDNALLLSAPAASEESN